ncbi:MAG TPA: nuclear transport factor 2 family protein [Longimicrobiales bacterium]|nr:nuclear transport factor 2 family protein [Longimicrobiales bacterium]
MGLAIMSAGCTAAQGPRGGADGGHAAVRAELERLYAVNAAAFMRGDIEGVMALRAPDFHTVTPDEKVHDRAAMRLYMEGFMNGVRSWKQTTFTIDSLTLVGDTAYAIVSQYADRMALRPDERVHHVQTWVTQREIWIRSARGWLMWRVDRLRNQRRLVDGKPG